MFRFAFILFASIGLSATCLAQSIIVPRNHQYQYQYHYDFGSTQSLQPRSSSSFLSGRTDALDEVNFKRAKRGMRPLDRDPLLTIAAMACARQRAARGIHGHLPESDFHYLPFGGRATSAGCAALESGWGWQACAWDNPRYTVGGAAWIMGRDGLRYNHIFVR